MSTNKKKKKKNEFLKSIFFKANAIAGCGCDGSGCGRPKLCDVIEPIPIPIPIPIPKTSSSSTLQNPDQLLPSSSSSCDNNRNGSRSLDDGEDDDDERGFMVETCCSSSTRVVLKDSIAVAKDSEDPFEDFKASMKQMIVEKRICSDEDLKALLNCFLELNSPFHHDAILRAFTHISNQSTVSAGRPSISISQDDDHQPSDHS